MSVVRIEYGVKVEADFWEDSETYYIGTFRDRESAEKVAEVEARNLSNTVTVVQLVTTVEEGAL